MTIENDKKLPDSSIVLFRERLRKTFEYDPETGYLYWKNPNSNSVSAGQIAGTINPNGYTVVRFEGTRYIIHRLIWVYMKGYWPITVDHINGSRSDNRWCNLREATHAQNTMNKPARADNELGVKGIRKRGNKFQVRIALDGVEYYLGTYDTIEEAVDVRNKKEIEFYGEFAFKGSET
jgi:hypothetical protein